MTRGEQGFLDWVARATLGARGLLVPIGSDAAVFRPRRARDMVVTTDAIAEGSHFLPTDPPRLIGRKCLAVSLSDIAAMGARPRYAFIAAVLPRGFPARLPREITRGILALAKEHGTILAGGDTNTHAGGLVLTSTVIGEIPAGRIISRRGARPGDVVAVTGALGGSLASGRHLRFEPRVRQGLTIRRLGPPSAMMDVSDGLLLDLWRLTRASGVGARVFQERVPIHRDVGPNRELALSEGEDFELLFTMAPERFRRLAARWPHETAVTAIGEIVASGFTIVEAGIERKARPLGFQHH